MKTRPKKETAAQIDSNFVEENWRRHLHHSTFYFILFSKLVVIICARDQMGSLDRSWHACKRRHHHPDAVSYDVIRRFY